MKGQKHKERSKEADTPEKWSDTKRDQCPGGHRHQSWETNGDNSINTNADTPTVGCIVNPNDSQLFGEFHNLFSRFQQSSPCWCNYSIISYFARQLWRIEVNPSPHPSQRAPGPLHPAMAAPVAALVLLFALRACRMSVRCKMLTWFKWNVPRSAACLLTLKTYCRKKHAKHKFRNFFEEYRFVGNCPTWIVTKSDTLQPKVTVNEPAASHWMQIKCLTGSIAISKLRLLRTSSGSVPLAICRCRHRSNFCR